MLRCPAVDESSSLLKAGLLRYSLAEVRAPAPGGTGILVSVDPTLQKELISHDSDCPVKSSLQTDGIMRS
ncbi:hypothetical protein VTN00DRAFT_7035 [Thermoascus crustaceus]|uniref:uncharacterized protein n=1 Tax=Thermoascus crustaceus TaxID=5088 RepID=UPI0037446A17